MKKALYYSIRLGGLYGPRLVAVTLVRRSHWWGRDTRDDLGTHGRTSDLAGQFETLEEAQAVLSRIDDVVIPFAGEFEKLNQARKRLDFAKDQMLKQITMSSPQRGAELLKVKVEVAA